MDTKIGRCIMEIAGGAKKRSETEACFLTVAAKAPHPDRVLDGIPPDTRVVIAGVTWAFYAAAKINACSRSAARRSSSVKNYPNPDLAIEIDLFTIEDRPAGNLRGAESSRILAGPARVRIDRAARHSRDIRCRGEKPFPTHQARRSRAVDLGRGRALLGILKTDALARTQPSIVSTAPTQSVGPQNTLRSATRTYTSPKRKRVGLFYSLFCTDSLRSRHSIYTTRLSDPELQ